MRFREKIVAGAMGTAALTMMFATTSPTASAAADRNSPGSDTREASAAAWTPTTTLNNGPIRECYAAGCAEVWRPGPGETVRWSHYAYNSSGNRWYYVQYVVGNGTPHTFYGWIYCGNVAAPC
ncbi:hypothetical protein [Embleya hyalina]|uniref:SH3b domain-containing protein n=1 Tax=Embleya hyalina TaxID=516124 RepID=A0A401Z4P9_9ACTN|nr:hypothetical protein [Embleya hyalina]GCE01823.1 hypothetical protein EHYA_09597 [Embleya hyalina]